MSSSSDSEFYGFLQEFSVVDTVVDGSDISITDVDTDDLSSDDEGDGSNDAGGNQEFSEMSTFCRSVNELVRHTLSPLTPLN